jgi:general secretion pathway protein H
MTRPLPSPLWGGVGGGGRAVEQGCAPRHDPPPRPSPSRNRVYAGFGHLIKRSKSATADFDWGEGEEGAAPHAIAAATRGSKADREAGFSLIEVVAVMLIIALLSGLAVAMMPGTGRPKLRAVALETAALFRRERLGAVLTGRNRLVSLDGEGRALVGDGGGVVAIPRDVVVDILGVDEQLAGRQTVVRFHPDGASSGAVLRFSRQGAEYEVRVNWYTGGVAVESR